MRPLENVAACWPGAPGLPGAPAALSAIVHKFGRWKMLRPAGLVPLGWPGAPAALTQLFASSTVGKCCALLAWCPWAGLVPLPP